MANPLQEVEREFSSGDRNLYEIMRKTIYKSMGKTII
jgi:hypothetical protein